MDRPVRSAAQLSPRTSATQRQQRPGLRHSPARESAAGPLLARLDSELADLATRTTVKALASDQFTDEDPTIASVLYQQILAVLTPNPAGMRAEDLCLAVGVGPAPEARRRHPGTAFPVHPRSSGGMIG